MLLGSRWEVEEALTETFGCGTDAVTHGWAGLLLCEGEVVVSSQHAPQPALRL